jgi:hypothetical protein
MWLAFRERNAFWFGRVAPLCRQWILEELPSEKEHGGHPPTFEVLQFLRSE